MANNGNPYYPWEKASGDYYSSDGKQKCTLYVKSTGSQTEIKQKPRDIIIMLNGQNTRVIATGVTKTGDADVIISI